MTVSQDRVLEQWDVELADGRRVTIRQLQAGDADELALAYAHADPWDLRRRFMGTPPPVSWLVTRLRAADGVHDLALGAFTPQGRLVGVAQFDRVSDGPAAEVAILVAKSWQHDGLGIALLQHLAEIARKLGIHEFTATYYAENTPIRHLLRDVGPIVASSYEQGEGYARVDLDHAPTWRAQCDVPRSA